MHRRLGISWVLFALALALHVTDEATHDFLSYYNPAVRAIRERLPLLPLPTFTFGVWLTGLIAGIVFLLALSPFAFRGSRWLRFFAYPLALLVGVGNGCMHIATSLYFGKWLPGVYSSPTLLLAAGYLLWQLEGALKPTGEIPAAH